MPALITTLELFSLLIASPVFALNLQDFNQTLAKQLRKDRLSQPYVYKLPAGYITDHSINLVSLSTGIEERLIKEPALQPLSEIPTEVLDSRNNIILNMLERRAPPTSFGISFKKAVKIMQAARNHPVVGIQALDKYDPIDPKTHQRSLGFCFGRADYVYLQLLAERVPPKSILKLFQVGAIAGDPSFGRPWTNHIVTIVRNVDGGWLAIDPFYGMVAPVAQWVQRNSASAKNQKTILYFAPPLRENAQGGTMEKLAIMDPSFPPARAMTTYQSQPIETLNIWKTDLYYAYFNDFYADIRSHSTTGGDFLACMKLGWCVGP